MIGLGVWKMKYSIVKTLSVDIKHNVLAMRSCDLKNESLKGSERWQQLVGAFNLKNYESNFYHIRILSRANP